nr:hypothetical protein [Rhizobium leguminosarum]
MAQPLHQLQRLALICAPIRAEPLVQFVRNGLACQHLATVEIGGEGEIGRLAGLQFTVEDRNVDFIRTGPVISATVS